MKNIINSLLIPWVLCPILMVMLFVNTKRINSYKNHFSRNILPHFVLKKKVIELKPGDWSIVGETSSKIFLSEIKSINNIYEIDWMKDLRNYHWIQGPKNIKFVSPTIKIDSPNFYIQDGGLPLLVQGCLASWKINKVTRPEKRFSSLMVLTDSSYVITMLSQKKGITIGIKESGSMPMKKAVGISENKQLTIFDNDGIMSFCRDLKKIVYLNYYKNTYKVYHLNLNLAYTGKTLDTISVPKIVTSKVREEIKILYPSQPGNKQMWIDKKIMYVYSSLRADNEERKKSEHSAVIDAYNLESGLYLHSFYIDDQNGEHLRDFRVIGNCVYALFNSVICKYEINTIYRKVHK